MALYTAQTLIVLEDLYGVDYVDRLLDEGLGDMARKAKRALGTRAGAALATGAIALGGMAATGGAATVGNARYKAQQTKKQEVRQQQKTGARGRRAGQQRLRDLGYVIDKPNW